MKLHHVTLPVDIRTMWVELFKYRFASDYRENSFRSLQLKVTRMLEIVTRYDKNYYAVTPYNILRDLRG